MQVAAKLSESKETLNSVVEEIRHSENNAESQEKVEGSTAQQQLVRTCVWLIATTIHNT